MHQNRKAFVCGTVLSVSALLGVPAVGQVRIVADTVPAEERAAAVIDHNWKAPRTSWGHPDLEGIWTTDDMRSVPRERPAEFGTRTHLTPEEFAKRAASDADERDRILNRAAYSSRSVGSRTFGYTSAVVDPPNGRIPPMTETGLARAAPRDRGTFGQGPFNDFDDFTLYDRCITRGILGSKFSVVYGNGLRIVQNPDSVAISYEMLTDTRVIRLDGRPHLQGDIRQYMGNARGYWDGDTLVVETRNLTDRTSIGGNGNGVRHSEAMTITERFSRVDPEMIEYVATVNDPVTYTAPFTIRMMLTSQPGYEIFEYSCHEGNTAVQASLSGARTYELAVQESIDRGLPIPEPGNFNYPLDPLPADDEAVFFDVNAGQFVGQD